MIQTFTIRPKTDLKTNSPSEERLTATFNGISYTIAFIGPYTYSWETRVDNDIHVWDKTRGVPHNFHIGNGNSIGSDLRCVFGRNHNTKMVSSGGKRICTTVEFKRKMMERARFAKKGA